MENTFNIITLKIKYTVFQKMCVLLLLYVKGKLSNRKQINFGIKYKNQFLLKNFLKYNKFYTFHGHYLIMLVSFQIKISIFVINLKRNITY